MVLDSISLSLTSSLTPFNLTLRYFYLLKPCVCFPPEKKIVPVAAAYPGLAFFPITLLVYERLSFVPACSVPYHKVKTSRILVSSW